MGTESSATPRLQMPPAEIEELLTARVTKSALKQLWGLATALGAVVIAAFVWAGADYKDRVAALTDQQTKLTAKTQEVQDELAKVNSIYTELGSSGRQIEAHLQDQVLSAVRSGASLEKQAEFNQKQAHHNLELVQQSLQSVKHSIEEQESSLKEIGKRADGQAQSSVKAATSEIPGFVEKMKGSIKESTELRDNVQARLDSFWGQYDPLLKNIEQSGFFVFGEDKEQHVVLAQKAIEERFVVKLGKIDKGNVGEFAVNDPQKKPLCIQRDVAEGDTVWFSDDAYTYYITVQSTVGSGVGAQHEFALLQIGWETNPSHNVARTCTKRAAPTPPQGVLRAFHKD